MVQGSVSSKEDRIILLDYLITMKQLISIDANRDIEYFHQKSQI